MSPVNRIPVSPPLDLPPRARGGQPSNQNALKHGFYARTFRRGEGDDLETCQFKNLSNEINAMRVYIRRILATDNAEFSPAENLALYRTLSLAMLTLTRLLRTELLMVASRDDKMEALFAAAAACQADIEAEEQARLQALADAEKEKENKAEATPSPGAEVSISPNKPVSPLHYKGAPPEVAEGYAEIEYPGYGKLRNIGPYSPPGS